MSNAPRPQKVPPPIELPPIRSNLSSDSTFKNNIWTLPLESHRVHKLSISVCVCIMSQRHVDAVIYGYTFTIETPEPIFISRYGKMSGCVFWNRNSESACLAYTKASCGIFFRTKLHPLIRQVISSSLSTLRGKNK